MFLYFYPQALRDDVTSHERSVRQCTESALQFLQRQGDRLGREERDSLQQSASELRMRYERLAEQANSRVAQLGDASEYLRGFDRDVASFEHWMQDRLKTVEGFTRDAGRDINVLKKQSGQLQSVSADIQAHRDELDRINLSGQGFLNNAKTYKQMLHEFRTNALPRQFNKTFTEAPDSNIIQDRLVRLNDLFERLTSDGDLSSRRLQDLIMKHQVR